MADVNDASDLTGKHARRLEQVCEADIDEQDREAILSFHEYRRTKGKKPTTLTNDLSSLRCASKRARVPLTSMSKTDVEDLFSVLTKPKDDGGHGLDPNGGGMYNYTRALRIFFQWLNERNSDGTYSFWEEIETTKQTVERQPEENRLTASDIEKLKTAGGRGRNTQRDRALIAFLADGPRVTLTAQLRVGDIHIDLENPYWTPNTEADIGHKDIGPKERTLLWSQTEIRTWLHHGHPDPDNPEAPLWPVQHYDPENPQEGAMSTDAIRGMLERAAERAGIDKPVNPHNFRHTAFTRLSNDEGLSPQQIQHLAGWSDSRMLEVYDETTDRERNDSIRSALDMPTSVDDEERTTAEPRPCHNCNEIVTTERYCPNCGVEQSISKRMMKIQARDDVSTGLSEEPSESEKVEARAAIVDALEDPDFVDQLAEAALEKSQR